MPAIPLDFAGTTHKEQAWERSVPPLLLYLSGKSAEQHSHSIALVVSMTAARLTEQCFARAWPGGCRVDQCARTGIFTVLV